MNLAEEEEMRQEVLKILKHPELTNSDQFMKIYNLVYNFCTKPNTKFEILGAPIYNFLEDISNKHTKSLQGIVSIQMFNENYEKIEAIIAILDGAFSYLNRFYMKCAFLRRDHHVKNIRHLMLLNYYKNYVSKYRNTITKLISSEINILRDGGGSGRSLKTMINSYQTLLMFCDESRRFEMVKEDYVESFKDSTNLKKPINRAVSIVYRELSILHDVFDEDSYCELSKKIVSTIADRSEEVVDYLISKMAGKRNFYHAYKVLELSGVLYLDSTTNKIGRYIDQKFRSLNKFSDVFDFFIEFYDCVENEFGKNRHIRGVADTKFGTNIKDYMECQSRQDSNEFIVGLSKMAGSVVADDKRHRGDLIFKLINLVGSRAQVAGEITKDLQRRLLDDTRNVFDESYLVNRLCAVIDSDDYATAKHNVSDILFSRHFNTKYQSFDVVPMLLTFSFWGFRKDTVDLFGPLEDAINDLHKRLLYKFPRCNIDWNHRLSVVICRFCGFTLSLNSDVMSVLLMISESQGISYSQIFEVTTDRELRDTLEILKREELIFMEEQLYYVNINYKNGDLKILRDVESLLDARGERLNQDIPEIYLMEALCMKHLKKAVECTKEELMCEAKMYGGNDSDISVAIANLESNGYLKIVGSAVKYLA